MPIPTYTPGYPPDGSSLGQTKSTIRNNLDGTFETLGVDHINNNGQPGSNPAGYHNVIHMVQQGSDPMAISTFGQLYSKTINDVISDTALFWETGTGLIAQLTANFNPVASANGYTFLPGGIIFQWGRITGSPNIANNALVTFPLTFPNAVFSITLGGLTSSTADKTINISQGSIALNKFNVITSGSSSFTSLDWMAIGN